MESHNWSLEPLLNFIFSYSVYSCKKKSLFSHRSSVLTVRSVSDGLYPPGRDVPADFWLFLPRWSQLCSPCCPLKPWQLDMCRLAASFQRDTVSTMCWDYQSDGTAGLLREHFRELKFPRVELVLTHPCFGTVHNNPCLCQQQRQKRQQRRDASPEQFFPLAGIKCTYEGVYQCYIRAAESPSWKTDAYFCCFWWFYRLDTGWLMHVSMFALYRGFCLVFFAFIHLHGVSMHVYLVSRWLTTFCVNPIKAVDHGDVLDQVQARAHVSKKMYERRLSKMDCGVAVCSNASGNSLQRAILSSATMTFFGSFRCLGN